MFGQERREEMTLDEVLSVLADVDEIRVTYTDRQEGRSRETVATLEEVTEKLRALDRKNGGQRGFIPPRVVDGVAHIGPLIGGFADYS